MKSFLFSATILVISSCQNQFSKNLEKTNPAESTVVSEVMDFQAKRLSGSRVILSWHVKPNQSQNDFLVMRKSGIGGIFEKVGIVKPKQSNSVNDYVVTDFNESADSSFYSILQVDGKGVKYFSKAKGVEGKIQ
jgi:hypothetical protein